MRIGKFLTAERLLRLKVLLPCLCAPTACFYPHVRIQKPTEDVCGDCHKFKNNFNDVSDKTFAAQERARTVREKSENVGEAGKEEEEEEEDVPALDPRSDTGDQLLHLVADQFTEEDTEMIEQLEHMTNHVEDAKAQRELCNACMKESVAQAIGGHHPAQYARAFVFDFA